ncbi:KxYKxGKxW signal peptide domain-containing protein [Lacticaseibacillus chiayiensis]|uniref:KxYKxGKxW signal peptide domain-containing protein n=1 Tax=Lacticaseibacillus chiayiensis TaxID=2100821 RepID=UPI001BCEEDFD|nr:KxYKxGKxW signal peptide domain-containing protein [Lacticaseibacillus chiayiensis]QVI35599.1 KxYKxGKxW signal peptide domain-containing protein [Lacticaseibacillus chiayiensis]
MGKINRREQFIKENGKVRFRMYKAGKRWLVASTATVAGLLGGMFILPHNVQAANQPQVGKVVGKDDVLATQNTATIPANSTQASNTTSESTSVSEAGSLSESVSASAVSSTSISNSATNSLASDSQSESTTTSNSASQSNPVSQSSSGSQITSGSGSLSQSLSMSTSAQTSANQAKTSRTVAQAFAANVSVKAAADAIDPNSSDYKGAVSEATKYLKSNAGSLSLGLGTGGAVQKLTKLYDIYQKSNGTMMDDNGTADTSYDAMNVLGTWNPSSGSTIQWPRSANWSAGYAAATAAYVKGLLAWLDNINSKANDESAANAIIDYKAYDSTALQGTSGFLGTIANIAGALGGVISGLIDTWFGNGVYAPSIMNYTVDSSNIAADAVNTSIKNVNALVKLLATNIINGIAHEALADVRSIGGANTAMNKNSSTGTEISDYVPKSLSEAIALNDGYKKLVSGLGLDKVINSPLMEMVYEAIANVARHAIQYNFAIGFQKAVDIFLSTGKLGDGKSIYSSVKGYDDNNPAAMVGTTQSADLSVVTQASGFAWANKVLAPLVKYAASNALADAEAGNTDNKTKTSADLSAYLESQGAITADMQKQIDSGAGNQIVSGVAAYTRNPQGVQAVLVAFYNAEYAAVQKAFTDYQANPNMSADDISKNTPTFVAPSDPKLPANDSYYKDDSGAHSYSLGDYANVIHYLQSADAAYNAMVTADTNSHTRTTKGDISTTPGSFTPSFDNTLLGNVPENTDYATKLVTPVYDAAYTQEAKNANAAYKAGREAYLKDLVNYVNKETTVKPNASTSGSAQKPYTASSDTTATTYTSFNHESPELDSGTAFTDGYGSVIGLVVNYVD